MFFFFFLFRCDERRILTDEASPRRAGVGSTGRLPIVGLGAGRRIRGARARPQHSVRPLGGFRAVELRQLFVAFDGGGT